MIEIQRTILRFRWGVTDTADTDHTADLICLDEIERCIELSAGLNFIYFVGNRYGYLYVPLEIDEEEFETILTVAEEENLPHLDLLEKWFQLDHNAVPPKYVYVVSDINRTEEENLSISSSP